MAKILGWAIITVILGAFMTLLSIACGVWWFGPVFLGGLFTFTGLTMFAIILIKS
jgi:hypothetical protein